MAPLVQVSIDTLTIAEGVRRARIAVEAGADWIEVGTPLVTSAGAEAISALVEVSGGKSVLVDYKACDGVEPYFSECGKRGAHVATVMAFATNYSIAKAVKTAHEHGVLVMADLLAIPTPQMADRAQEVAALGVDWLLVHLSYDKWIAKDKKEDPLQGLAAVTSSTQLPVGVIVFDKDQARKAVDLGAKLLVVGTPIMESEHALTQLSEFIQSVR